MDINNASMAPKISISEAPNTANTASYTKKSPLVVRNIGSNGRDITTLEYLHIKASYVDIQLQNLIVSNFTVTSLSGNVNINNLEIKDAATVRLGVDLNSNKLCLPGIDTASTNQTNANSVRVSNSSNFCPASSVVNLLNESSCIGNYSSYQEVNNCLGAGGDISLTLVSNAYVVAYERNEAICMTGQNIESIKASNMTREAIMCVDVLSCTNLPKITAETIEGTIYVHARDKILNKLLVRNN